MIVITGAAGFIGSCMVRYFNSLGKKNLLLVDEFAREDKKLNLAGKDFVGWVDRDIFFDRIKEYGAKIELVIHIGARTDTAEMDKSIFDRLNVEYSKKLWQFCSDLNIGFIYASSAATYGDGTLGFKDNHDIVNNLKPLNPYGISKNDFDKWVLEQKQEPKYWAGLKFFNVYGPNEYHKGRMASVILHTFRQVKDTGAMKLFRSHHPDFKDGEQLRDFIYVKDLLEILSFLSQGKAENGLYNCGTGKARSFNALATATFNAMGLSPSISYMDTPEDIRGNYQYFTEAPMEKLRAQGFDLEFHSLEEGIQDYVQEYLINGIYY